jgi:hypothetical protein
MRIGRMKRIFYPFHPPDPLDPHPIASPNRLNPCSSVKSVIYFFWNIGPELSVYEDEGNFAFIFLLHPSRGNHEYRPNFTSNYDPVGKHAFGGSVRSGQPT